MEVIKRFLRYIFLGGCIGNLIGFLLLSFLLGGCYTLIVLTVSQNTKNTKTFQLAMTTLQKNEQAAELLGAPLSEGWIVTQDFEVVGGQETASLIVPVFGSARAGTIYASLVRSGENWQVESLFLELDDQLIDLEPDRETLRPIDLTSKFHPPSF